MGGEILKVLGFSKELKVNSVDLDKDNIDFKFFFWYIPAGWHWITHFILLIPVSTLDSHH